MNSYVYKDTLLPTHPEGFAFVRFIEDTLWPTHPEGFTFVRFIEDTLWPTHPVRFFSALSLEKNAPSEST